MRYSLRNMLRPLTRRIDARTGDLLRDSVSFGSSQTIQIHCAKTVPESNVFNPFELSLSEKQIPRFIGNVSS